MKQDTKYTRLLLNRFIGYTDSYNNNNIKTYMYIEGEWSAMKLLDDENLTTVTAFTFKGMQFFKMLC